VPGPLTVAPPACHEPDPGDSHDDSDSQPHLGDPVTWVDHAGEVCVDEAVSQFGLPVGLTQPILHRGERAQPLEGDDRETPARHRDVRDEHARPAPGQEAADDEEDEERKVHDHHDIRE